MADETQRAERLAELGTTYELNALACKECGNTVDAAVFTGIAIVFRELQRLHAEEGGES